MPYICPTCKGVYATLEMANEIYVCSWCGKILRAKRDALYYENLQKAQVK